MANALRDEFTVFLDSTEYAAGDSLRREGNRAVKKTSRLILVATPGVAKSSHVKRELSVFEDLQVHCLSPAEQIRLERLNTFIERTEQVCGTAERRVLKGAHPAKHGERRFSGQILGYGGFVIELGDREQYGSFDRFQQQIRQAKLETQWDAGTKTLDVAYTSGEDAIRFAYRPGYTGDWSHQVKTTEGRQRSGLEGRRYPDQAASGT